MRIAMLCSGHPVTDERVTHKQAVSLARAGHEVIVFGREAGGPPTLSGVTLVPLAPEGGGLGGRARMIRPLARMAAAWKPDVVTCHEPESALAGLWVRRKCGARVVFDVHEFFDLNLSARMPWLVRPLVRGASAALLRYVGRRAAWVTVVSDEMAGIYRRLRNDDRVTVIMNSPRLEWFPPCRHDVTGPVTICHDGILNASRGMSQLLEAFALARRQADVRLLIVGKVEEGERPAFDAQVQALGLAEAIEMPGWVRYERVGEILSRGQVGVVTIQPRWPNNYKALSNKLFNYMCCGQAAVVHKNSPTADLVRDADCGLAVDSTRPEEIAGAIVSLAQDPVLRQRLGANGRRAIEQAYGWHVMEKRLIEIYAQLK